MASRNGPVVCPANEPTQLTAGDVTAIRVSNLSAFEVPLIATIGATPPTTTDGQQPLNPRETLAADLTLAQLWPGLVGANRVWAWPTQNVVLSVSHA